MLLRRLLLDLARRESLVEESSEEGAGEDEDVSGAGTGVEWW